MRNVETPVIAYYLRSAHLHMTQSPRYKTSICLTLGSVRAYSILMCDDMLWSLHESPLSQITERTPRLQRKHIGNKFGKVVRYKTVATPNESKNKMCPVKKKNRKTCRREYSVPFNVNFSLPLAKHIPKANVNDITMKIQVQADEKYC